MKVSVSLITLVPWRTTRKFAEEFSTTCDLLIGPNTSQIEVTGDKKVTHQIIILGKFLFLEKEDDKEREMKPIGGGRPPEAYKTLLNIL